MITYSETEKISERSQYPTLNETTADVDGNASCDLPDRFTRIVESVAADIMDGENVFVTGGAGVGKSVLIQQVSRILERECPGPIIKLAPTGVAAVNIDGLTTHAWVGHHPAGETTMHDIEFKPESKYMKSLIEGVIRWGTAKQCPPVSELPCVIIIDEISMVRRDMFEYMMDVLEKIYKKWESFDIHARIPLLFVGDFLQLPPVVTDISVKDLRRYYPQFVKASTGEVCANVFGETPQYYAFESPMWYALHLKSYKLDIPLRQSNDLPFYEMLDRIRRGDVTVAGNLIRATIEDDIVDHYGRKVSVSTDECQLFYRNDQVDKHNKKMLAIDPHIKGDKKSYTVTRSSIRENADGSLSTKSLMDKSIQNKIDLYVGALVMCTANNSKEGYFNGEMGRVTHMETDIHNRIKYVFVHLTKRDVTVMVTPTIRYGYSPFHPDTVVEECLDRFGSIEVLNELHDEACRRQYQGHPLTRDEYNDVIANYEKYVDALRGDLPRTTMTMIATCGMKYLPCTLAYAFTVHKSQGKTLEYVGVDTSSINQPGQFYVAVSRCTRLEGLRFTTPYGKNMPPITDPEALAFVERMEASESEFKCIDDTVRQHMQKRYADARSKNPKKVV